MRIHGFVSKCLAYRTFCGSSETPPTIFGPCHQAGFQKSIKNRYMKMDTLRKRPPQHCWGGLFAKENLNFRRFLKIFQKTDSAYLRKVDFEIVGGVGSLGSLRHDRFYEGHAWSKIGPARDPRPEIKPTPNAA